MKTKTFILTIFFVFVIMASLVVAADYKKDIVGTWTYEFKGQNATMDHMADGTFTLVMGKVTAKGTYTVTGSNLVLVTDGKNTPYAIQSFDGKKMTLKREKDGRVIEYIKK